MRVWISGDSWGDFTSLLRSKVYYRHSLNGRFEKHNHSVLQLARGGNGNRSQFFILEKHAKNSIDKPDIWIHFWTEIGRDLIHTDWLEKTANVETSLEKQYIAHTQNALLPLMKDDTKILFIGGQSPVPKSYIDAFKNRIDFIPDWKSKILNQELPYNQFMSMLTGGNDKIELCKRWLSKKDFNEYQKLSITHRDILEQSRRFPDNAHPDAQAYEDLWNDIKERYSI